MALSSTITLDDASGDDVVFVLTKTNGDGTTRIDQTATLSLPHLLNVKHSTTGKGVDAVDRHLIQIVKSVSATPADVQVVANFTLAVPRNVAVTSAIIYDVIANICDFLMSGGLTTLASTTNIDAVLRGES
jgi:hypothetical protein